MSEFTGERVIPGEVNPDLWAEHFSRYAFASRLAGGRRALDVGCGTGYGTAEIAHVARFTAGCDPAAEALNYAQLHYPGPEYVRASACALPFANASFDFVTAFEVIEHLENWPALLEESGRILTPDGLLVVSTPNKLYYAESRAESGPNPYHAHEFEFEEFRCALTQVFRNVAIYLQNHASAFSICPADQYAASEATIEAPLGNPAEANFYIAICSQQPFTLPPALLYAPKASNVLREREQHIKLLESELRQNKQWLAETMDSREQLQKKHAELTEHLEQHNQWALDLEKKWKEASERIVALQDELQQSIEGYERQIGILQDENSQKTQWALDTEERLTAEVKSRAQELARTVRLLDKSESLVVERTRWAQSLESELRENIERLVMIEHSRWFRLGRMLGLGPSFVRAKGSGTRGG